MKLNELKESTQELVLANYGATMKDVLGDIRGIFVDVADEFKEHKKDATSVPSAPNTQTFRATVGGMIEVERNVHIHGGQYGFPKTYLVFLKIGGGIDYKVQKRMIDSVADAINNEVAGMNGADFKIPGDIWCSDGRVIFGTEHGTNWGGVGVYTDPYSDYNRKKYEAAKGDD